MSSVSFSVQRSLNERLFQAAAPLKQKLHLRALVLGFGNEGKQLLHLNE